MKYKVGDKVKYNSGDWLFYGTVTAVMDNSICPCYRLNVEQMVKQNCMFSITQFEFELESDMEGEILKEKHTWEKSESEYLKKYFTVKTQEELPKEILSELVTELATKPEPVPEKSVQRRMQREKKPAKGKVELSAMPDTDAPRRKREGTWETYYELYKQGEKSVLINAWIANNRRQYKTGKLKEDKLQQLTEINFPFEPTRKRVTKKKRKQRRTTGKKV